MLNKEDFERFSYAFEKYLFSSRMRVRRLEEQEEDELLRFYLNRLEDIICQLRDSINESIQKGNWIPLIDAFAETGLCFQTRKEAENFIVSIASNRIRVEKES